MDTLKRKAASALIEEELTQSQYSRAVCRLARSETSVRALKSPALEVDVVAAMSDVESTQFFEARAAASLQIKKLQVEIDSASAIADRCVKQLASHKKATTERAYFLSGLQGLASTPVVTTIKNCTVCLTGTSNLVAIECANSHATCFDCVVHRLSQQASFLPEEAAAVCCSDPSCLAVFSQAAVCRAVAGQPAAVGYLRKATEVQATAAAVRQAEEATGAELALGACGFARNKLEDALVLRCPTPGCKVMFSIEAHDECYALECSGCNQSFCGLCLVSLADMSHEKEGLYTHAHVRTCCMSSTPGEMYFSPRAFPGERGRIIARLLALNCLKVLRDFGEEVRRRVLLSCSEVLARADLSPNEPYLVRAEWQTPEFKRRAHLTMQYMQVHNPAPTRDALIYSDQLLDSLLRKENNLSKHLRIAQEVATTHCLFQEMAELPQYGATDAHKCVFNRNIGSLLARTAELAAILGDMKMKNLAVIYAFGEQESATSTAASQATKDAQLKAEELKALYSVALKPLTDLLLLGDPSFEAARAFQKAVVAHWKRSNSSYGGTAHSQVLCMVHEAMGHAATSPIAFVMPRWAPVASPADDSSSEEEDDKSDDSESEYALQDTSDEDESDSESE